MEEEDEEKEEAVDLCESDVGVEDVALSSHDGETHEHDANASLDGHVGNDEERFAQPPILGTSVRSSQSCTSKHQIPSMRSEDRSGV